MPKGKYDRTRLLLVEATELQGEHKIIYKRDRRIIRVLRNQERMFHRYGGFASLNKIKLMREEMQKEAAALNL